MRAAITKQFGFHAGHRLENHGGKCRRLHGHTYKVDVEVGGLVSEEMDTPGEGMVIDFDELKAAWAPIDDLFDHRFMLSTSDPLFEDLQNREPDSVVPFDSPPTAERIAERIAIMLSRNGLFRLGGASLYCVRVWETPTSYAEYRP